MPLNPYVWRLYKESEEGQEAIADYTVDWASFWATYQSEALTTPQADGGDAFTESDASDLDIVESIHDALSRSTPATIDEAVQWYADAVTHGIPVFRAGNPLSQWLFGEEGWDWYEFIDFVSEILYATCSDYFLPYLFTPSSGDGLTFHVLDEICSEFGIALPPPPLKRDKPGKALYYGELMRTLYEFRQLHGLSPAEMCAFLYDFGIKVTEPTEEQDLPKPSKVWLIKGGGEDIAFVEEATPSTVAYQWGANRDIRRGDILLMYLRSPRSHIHSVWRAFSDAYVDPFFHYHDAVALGARVQTPPVTFQEMKADPVLGQKGLIRRSLQGASGDPFTVEEYNAVLAIMARKGQDISLLPKLEPQSYPDAVEISDERDVERLLVEPLLARLGYAEADWIRQMPIRMGRGERNYPDYAFGAVTTRGEETARMVLEAKYRISTRKQLRDAFYQAKSYALRLQAKHIVLCAMDGVWIFETRRDRFDLEVYGHKHWNELSHPDTLHEVSKIIGRRNVLGAR